MQMAGVAANARGAGEYLNLIKLSAWNPGYLNAEQTGFRRSLAWPPPLRTLGGACSIIDAPFALLSFAHFSV